MSALKRRVARIEATASPWTLEDFAALTDAELNALIASHPPDPQQDEWIKSLTDEQLDAIIRGDGLPLRRLKPMIYDA